MVRRLLKLLLVAGPLALLMGAALILFFGPESHRGNVDYLRWKYGLGPYRSYIVPKMLGHDRGFQHSIAGKDESWIRGRFPKLEPSTEHEKFLREFFHCPNGEIYEVDHSEIFVVIYQGKGVGMMLCKGT